MPPDRNAATADASALTRDAPTTLPYVQVAREATLPVPDTDDRGSFAVERNCLTFVTGSGKRYAPVLPAGSGIAADGPGRWIVAIGARTIELGRPYAVIGGEGVYGTRPPGSCPDTQFIIGGFK